MSYRVVVMFDDEVILDETAEMGGWVGLEGEAYPHNVAVALTEYGQETHQDQLLQDVINGSSATDEQKAQLVKTFVHGRRTPSLTFSYDDPGPKKKDGAAVRSNIERDIPGSFIVPCSAYAGDNPNAIHQFTVLVEEAVA